MGKTKSKSQSAKPQHLWSKLPASIRQIAQIITAVTVIGGAYVACVGWIETNLTAATNERIDAVEATLESEILAADQSLARIELLLLIQHDPENVVEIERVAERYFVDLDGDWYMASIYSQWASVYGGDTSFVK